MLHGLIARILVEERRWRVGCLLMVVMLLVMLLRMTKGAVIMELRRDMVAESSHIHDGGALKSIRRRGEGERGPKTHPHPHARCMEVASLIMV